MVQRQQRLRLGLIAAWDTHHDGLLRVGNPLHETVKPGLETLFVRLGGVRLGAEGLEGLDDLLRLRRGALRLENEEIGR